jgi:hypothetical protein
MPKTGDLEDKIYKQMVLCWNLDPNERPKFAVLHDYFENYDTKYEDEY